MMKKPVQTYSGFLGEICKGLTIESVLSALGMLKLGWRTSLVIFIVIGFLTVIFIACCRYERFFKMMRTGTLGYYYTFDYHDNIHVYDQAGESLCYLGISANSIIEYLRRWAEENEFPAKCRFLLLDYDEIDALVEQKRFERGISLEEDGILADKIRNQLLREAETEAMRIKTAIEVLKSLEGLRGKLEIRLYKEFIPWWMYMVDDKKIYMGILKAGKRGQDSSVMTLKKNKEFQSPFDPLKYKWDSLWRKSRPV